MENEKKVFLILSSIFSLVFIMTMIFLEKKESKKKSKEIINCTSKFFSQIERKRRYKKMESLKERTVEVSVGDILKQVSSNDLLDELMSREVSREELEKIAIGFIFKKLDFNEREINEVLEMTIQKNCRKRREANN